MALYTFFFELDETYLVEASSAPEALIKVFVYYRTHALFYPERIGKWDVSIYETKKTESGVYDEHFVGLITQFEDVQPGTVKMRFHPDGNLRVYETIIAEFDQLGNILRSR